MSCIKNFAIAFLGLIFLCSSAHARPLDLGNQICEWPPRVAVGTILESPLLPSDDIWNTDFDLPTRTPIVEWTRYCVLPEPKDSYCDHVNGTFVELRWTEGTINDAGFLDFTKCEMTYSCCYSRSNFFRFK